MSYNKAILIGRLGKDPEVRHLENGITVGNFTLATNEYFKDRNGERQERTEWHNIEVWRGLADIAEKYLTKGKQVCIEGRIKTESWEDKETGNTRYKTKIVAESMVMLDKKGNNPQDGEYNQEPKTTEPASQERVTSEKTSGNKGEIVDDLPF